MEDEIIRTEVDEKTKQKKIILDMDKLKEELDKGELFFCEDIKKGLKVELHSRIISIQELTSLGLGTFSWLEGDKKLIENKKQKNSMIG